LNTSKAEVPLALRMPEFLRILAIPKALKACNN
jgi:hypothetical protein